MENAGYLLAAFSAAWTILFGYVLFLLNKQRRLQQDINSLKEAPKQEKRD